MSTQYRCPNPACTHVFLAAELMNRAMVTCPVCQMAIQLRVAAPAPTSYQATPPAYPPATQSAATQAYTPPGVARYAPAPPDAGHAAPQPEANEDFARPIVVSRGRQKSGNSFQSLLVGGAILGFLGITAGGIYTIFMRSTAGGGGDVAAHRSEQFNFTFRPPGPAWKRDDETRERIGVNLFTLHRNDPSAWVAMAARDFGTRTPTARELEDEARRKLSAFVRNLETTPEKGKPIEDQQDFGGRKAQRIVFQGDIGEIPVTGECLFVSQQGVGYWFFAWGQADQANALSTEFDLLRKQFEIGPPRSDWKLEDKRRKEYTGKALAYSFVDPEGRWQLREPATDYDPKADIALFGPDRHEPRNVRKAADLMVVILDNSAAGAEGARKHLLEKHKREGYDATTIENADDAAGEDKVGTAEGKLLNWRIQNDANRIRFALVGVVKAGEKLVVLYAECDWGQRSSWEPQFRQLYDRFKLPAE